MSKSATSQTARKESVPVSAAPSGLLQRKCACGNHTVAGGECADCSKEKNLLQRKAIDQAVHDLPLLPIQTKLAIGSSNDPLEQEADRIADQAMSAPAHSGVSVAPVKVQRFAGRSIDAKGATAPPTVDRVLASPGRPLDPALRQDMEQRFGHDFSQVRVHTDSAAAQSARDVSSHAYTKKTAIVFATGRFSPSTSEGRRLLAHELAHVVQQGVRINAMPVQREATKSEEFLAPSALVDKFKDAMNQKFFGKLASVLVDAVYYHPNPYQYISEVFEEVHDWDSDYEDNLGAEFVSQLPKAKLDQMASAFDGRQTLTVLYEAIITGSVSDFEREQANKILMAKARAYKPEDYVKMTRVREGGKRTRIFPIRFMRVTPGYDYAPPLAELQPNGRIRVKYPVSVMNMSMFNAEVATLEGGFFLGKGEEINPNEIVGIKDYERGGGVQYLPALALIDYSNQAVRSTAGKILEVSIFAATMGIGGGAAAGGGVAATEVRMTAIWAARLTKVASVLDRVANVVGIASFVINENRDWIIRKLGKRGEQLVKISEVANSIAGVYGIARLGQAGYAIVKEMQTASKAARLEAKALTLEEDVVLRHLDDETDSLLKQLDDETAKSVPKKEASSVEKPSAGDKVDAGPSKSGGAKPTKAGPDTGITAKHVSPDGEVIKIANDGTIWVCTNPCEKFAETYRHVLSKNTDLSDELDKIRKIADPTKQAEALGSLKVKVDKAPIKDWQYLATDGNFKFLHGGKVLRGNSLRLTPDDWTHILEGHVKSTFDASKRGTSKVSTVFKGTPADYMEILEEAVKNKAVIRDLNKGEGVIRLRLRNQEWVLHVDLKENAIKTFHATSPITNKHLFEVIRVP